MKFQLIIKGTFLLMSSWS